MATVTGGMMPSTAPMSVSPAWGPTGGAALGGSRHGGGGGSSHRMLVLNQSMFHIIGVPLLILGSIGVGFVLVYLKEVLLPFVVSVFIVYLLRPLVNLLTLPFGTVFRCCLPPPTGPVIATHGPRGRGYMRGGTGGYARLPHADADGGGGASGAGLVGVGGSGAGSAGGTTLAGGTIGGGGGVGGVGVGGGVRRSRAASPPKYNRTVRGLASRVLSTFTNWASSAGGGVGGGGGGGGGSSGGGGVGGGIALTNVTVAGGTGLVASVGGGGGSTGGGVSGARSGAASPTGGMGAGFSSDEECGCCCGVCRMTRCPRWFAILISICFAVSALAGLVLLIADAIQRFQQDSLEIYIAQAGVVARDLQSWFAVFGIHLEAAAVLEVITKQISVMNVVQATLTLIVDGVGNGILIILLVLYLLAEQSQHAPGSIRAKVDNQIQRYVVIKTAISAGQGVVVFFILGYLLNVRMAHLFGALHFFLNYIPTAGPIIATVVPMPIVILDPELGLTSKVVAFAAPTAVHMVVGNFLEPLVFGSSMELHPVTILLSLAVWYALWGVPGAILAVPITAVMRIILSAIDHTYAYILINILEGRLSAASAEIEGALETSLDVDMDVEAGPGGISVRPRSSGTASEAGLGSSGVLGRLTPLHGDDVHALPDLTPHRPNTMTSGFPAMGGGGGGSIAMTTLAGASGLSKRQLSGHAVSASSPSVTLGPGGPASSLVAADSVAVNPLSTRVVSDATTGSTGSVGGGGGMAQSGRRDTEDSMMAGSWPELSVTASTTVLPASAISHRGGGSSSLGGGGGGGLTSACGSGRGTGVMSGLDASVPGGAGSGNSGGGGGSSGSNGNNSR